MNKLPVAKRAQILAMLCEGMSMRAVSRLADVSINTVTKLLVDAGVVCQQLHDERVRGLRVQRIEMDEIWSFTYAKAKNVADCTNAPLEAGDTWTFTAIDADSKLIVSYLVGDRWVGTAMEFVWDVRDRIDGRVQISTDGHKPYFTAVDAAFGTDADYAIIQKIYGSDPDVRRFSPPEVTGSKKEIVSGNPNWKHISTSYVERSNLTMRMHNRRFTRLTNGFSKKLENHVHMIAIYTVFYNFLKLHKTTRVTPAMAAGLTDHVWSWEEVVALLD